MPLPPPSTFDNDESISQEVKQWLHEVYKNFSEWRSMGVQTRTSGTDPFLWTGIPTFLELRLIFTGVSTDGTQALRIRLGTDSAIDTTNYQSASSRLSGSAVASISNTGSFAINRTATGDNVAGEMIIRLSDGIWVSNHTMADDNGSAVTWTGGGKCTISGRVTQLQVDVNSDDWDSTSKIELLYRR